MYVMATTRHLFVIAARARNPREVARKPGQARPGRTDGDLSPPILHSMYLVHSSAHSFLRQCRKVGGFETPDNRPSRAREGDDERGGGADRWVVGAARHASGAGSPLATKLGSQAS